MTSSPSPSPSPPPPRSPDVPRRTFAVIVGSGFSGLAMAIALKKVGLDDLVILEQADAVGGTWRDNTYPGCACDVPSHLYSYSFELNPRWSRTYSAQPEIRAYVEHCTEKYDLRRHVALSQEVVACTFDEEKGEWTTETKRGDVFVSTILVLAVGGLSKPFIAKIPGQETFAGPAFHSARWRHDVDLSGKRVGVVGTGASAIQFVPKIAPVAAALTLFQRTPAWVLPRNDRAFSEAEKQRFAAHPSWLRGYRGSIYALQESFIAAFIGEPRLLEAAAVFAKRHLAAAIADPVLRDKLTPRYTMGCKRILTSNDYYPALARPNVDVVTDKIERVDESGIITTGGQHHPCDVLIYGTGFAVHDYLGGLPVRGLGGKNVHDLWTRGAEAYLGTTIAGFPNCFALLGPNVGLGHNSIIFMIEAQVKHVMDVVRRLRGSGEKWIDVRPEVVRRFNDELHARFTGTVWSSGCASWYLDANGRNTTLWPASTAEFWARTRRFHPEAYRLRSEVPLAERGSGKHEPSPPKPHGVVVGADP